MNEDDIQPQRHSISYNKCCGLVMNEDDIQRGKGMGMTRICCGLVMNEDDIQPVQNPHLVQKVVVW